MAFIQIKSPKGTFFFQSAQGAQAAFSAFQRQIGGGGTFKSISQSAFTSGLAGFGFGPSGQPLAKKAVPKPVAKKVVPKKVGPTAEQIAGDKARKLLITQQAGLKKEGSALQSAYDKFVFGQEKVPDLRARLAEELGIPELSAQLEPLRKRSLELEGLLADLPENIDALSGRHGKAFRDLLLASKGGELDRSIAANARSQQLFAGQVTGAQAELVAQLSTWEQQYIREISTFQTKITAFQARAARESSSFSTGVQMSLNANLQGIQRISDIAEAALDRIHQEAMAEQQFLNDLEKISAQGAQTRANQASAGESNTDVIKGVVLRNIQAFRQGIESGTPNTREGIKAAILSEGGDPNDPALQGLYAWIAKKGGFGIGYAGSDNKSKKGSFIEDHDTWTRGGKKGAEPKIADY